MVSNDAAVEEDQIVLKAVEGDQQAFSAIFDLYYKPINRYFFFHGTDEKEAEDLTDAVFFKAWKNMQRFNVNKGTFKAWIYRIAHNTLIDHYRQRKDMVSIDAVHGIADTTSHAEERVIKDEEVQLLRHALDRLDERSRMIIVYRFIVGLDHRQTARLVGVSEGNVRIIQMRALKKLKSFFSEEYDG
jgi:RNA polymerase sigma-70 factor (ECF subfamily)